MLIRTAFFFAFILGVPIGIVTLAYNTLVDVIMTIGTIVFGKPIAEMLVDRKLKQANSKVNAAIACKKWLSTQK